MSSWDKILRWQCLGLQGALLSQVSEPIRFSSLIIGCDKLMDISALSLSARLPALHLPEPYGLVSPPLVLNKTIEGGRDLQGQCTTSLNWNARDQTSETMDLSECAWLFQTPLSRLSRIELFRLYSDLRRECPRGTVDDVASEDTETSADSDAMPDPSTTPPEGDKTPPGSGQTYHQAKQLDKEYCSARKQFLAGVQSQLKSHWVTKSPSMFEFSL